MDTSRQDTLVVATARTFHIVGCGGVGSWIALWLAKALPSAIFHLWDGDMVEASNLHRTPYTRDHVGAVKSAALNEILAAHGAGIVFTHSHWSQDVDMIAQDDTVIAAVDSMKVRRELYHATVRCIVKAAQYADAKGDWRGDAEYWDVGAEGTGANISDSPADFEIDGADAHRGYFTPIFIGPVAAIASMVVWRILRGLPPVDMRVDENDGNITWRTT